MNKVYQVIQLLRLQILSFIANHASVKTPGFPIFLALIMLVIMPFLLIGDQYVVPTKLFESTNDSFRVGIPEGWVIQDVNNTGSMLIQESTQGYGILAQLCLGEEEEGRQQQQQRGEAASTGSCQQQQSQEEEIIHIIRYPDLGARLGITVNDINDIIPDSIVEYQIQKLQEFGYRDINIAASVDASIPVDNTDDATGGVVGTAPAKLVVLTYSSSSAPSEIRGGYLYLTATNATPPDLKTITGYSLFYQGASGPTAASAQETTRSGGIIPISSEVLDILNSFELVASEEAVRFIFNTVAQQPDAEELSQPTYATQYLDTTSLMLIIVYSLLVIGVVWKFISYIRENRSLRLNEIS